MQIKKIPSQIFGIAKKAGSWITRRKSEEIKTVVNKEAQELQKPQLGSFAQVKTSNLEQSFNIAPQLQKYIEELKITDSNIKDGTKEFEQILKNNIVPKVAEGIQKIEYSKSSSDASELSNSLKYFFNERLKDYQTRINNINSKNTNSGTSVVSEEYKNIFHDYFNENLTLIHNLSNLVFKRITNLENYKTSDLEIAQAFKVTRDLTTQLSNKILEDYGELLHKMKEGFPYNSQEGLPSLLNSINDDFKQQIIVLNQGSIYGIQDRDLTEVFNKLYVEKLNRTNFSETDLTVLKEFHSGIHSSSQIKNNLDGYEISTLDQEIVEKAVKYLNTLLIQRASLTNQKPNKNKKTLDLKIQGLTKFIESLGKEEKRNVSRYKIFSSAERLSKHDISPNDLTELDSVYKDINQVDSFLGRMQEDIAAGERVPEEALLNCFQGQHKSTLFHKNYERLILEISLVAGYHALSGHMDGLSESEREAFFKDTVKFGNFKKENIPWLKDLYNQELNKYQKMINNDKSERKTADLAVALCNISQRLASREIDTYQSNDLFNRYNLVEIAEKALSRVSTMTDINTSALALKLFSELFSNMDKDLEAADLKPDEAKNLSVHVESLKKLFTITGKDGKPLYAAGDGNPYEDKKYEFIKEKFEKSGLVNLRLDLVLKYFNNSVKQKRDAARGRDVFSDLESRNLLLSSSLMYFYLKFMPEESSTVESLKAREKVISTFFNPKREINTSLPKVLGSKIFDQFMGTESDQDTNPISAAKYKRKGFLRSYALELQNKISKYTQGYEYKDIDLKTLLHLYYNLEKIKEQSLEIERKENPGLATKDIPYSKLKLWSRQEQNHINFHNGSSQALLAPLKDQLIALLENHPIQVTSFISSLKDDEKKAELAKEVSKALFKKAAETAADVLKYKHSDGIVDIQDNNIALLNQTINSFANLSRISILMDKGNRSKFKISEESILGEDDRQTFIQQRKIILDLLSSKFSLINSEQTSGVNIRQTKNILLNLLKSFQQKTANGLHLEWLNEDKVNKYREEEGSGDRRVAITPHRYQSGLQRQGKYSPYSFSA